MDSIDRDILGLLEHDGRISHEEIGKRLHLSRPAVHKRVERLEKEGVIKGYRAIIDWRKVEPSCTCFVFLKINGGQFINIANEVMKLGIPNAVIEECYRLAGEWCVLLKVRVASPEDTTMLLDRVWQIEGVRETSTTFVITTVL